MVLSRIPFYDHGMNASGGAAKKIKGTKKYIHNKLAVYVEVN